MNDQASWSEWKLSHAYPRIGSGTTPTAGSDDYYTVDNGTPWITTSELRENYVRKTKMRVTPLALSEYSTLRIYEPNTLFIAMYGATIGRLGMSTVAATCNQACCAFEKSEKFENRFLFYWLWHRRQQLISQSVGGGQPNLSQQDLKEEKALCPPLSVQRKIIRFLDAETEQIDALIEKKQALLERLAEKRRAVITEAVTKGLNPDAPMKDSGIEWLGQIPSHWEVKRLTGFCDFQSGKAHEPFIDPDGAFVCVNARFISTDGQAVKMCSENLCPAKHGDILMVMSDLPNGRALARSFLVDEKAEYAVNQRVCRIRPHIGNSTYLSHQLNRNLQLLAHNDGKEQTHLSNSAFLHLKLLFPPPDEQVEIAETVTNIEAGARVSEQAIERSAALLQEYRAALITAAVTGQIEGLQ